MEKRADGNTACGNARETRGSISLRSDAADLSLVLEDYSVALELLESANSEGGWSQVTGESSCCESVQ